MTHTQAIQLYYPTLQSVAYNILGSIADAEDAVHDAYVKWLTIDTSKVENTKAYLVRMVTNACLNMIQAKKTKQQVNVEIVESELVDTEKEKALFSFDAEEQLNEAWKFVHKKLEPLERAVFILREVFNVDYEDVQEIVDKKADNCRKIFSRAKAKLKETELPKLPLSMPDHTLLDNFKEACSKGNLTKLIQDFSSDLFSKKK